MFEQGGPINKLQKLHQNLLNEGYPIPKDFAVFSADMQDESKLSSLHKNLMSEHYDLPDFNTFKSDMWGGPKPKIAGSGKVTIDGKEASLQEAKSISKFISSLPEEKKGATNGKGGYKGTGLTEQEAMTQAVGAQIKSGKINVSRAVTAEDVRADLRRKEEEKKAEEKRLQDEAIFNLVERKTKKAAKSGVPYNEQDIKRISDEYAKKFESGEFVLDYDSRNGQVIPAIANTNGFTSFYDVYAKGKNESMQNDYIKTLSPEDLVRYYEIKKEEAAVDDEIGRKPAGFFGGLGGFGGGLISSFERPIVYGIATATGGELLAGAAGLTGVGALGTAATSGGESVAAQTAANIKNATNFSNTLAFMEDNAASSYAQGLNKNYNLSLKDIANPTKEQKISAASNAIKSAQREQLVGAAEGALFSMPLTKIAKGLPESANGYVETLLSSAKHTAKELPKFAAIAGGGSIIKGGIGAYYGSGETAGDIISEGIGAAAESAVLPTQLFLGNALKSAVTHAWALAANKIQAPSKAAYSRSLSIVSKFPDEIISNVYGKAESDGVVPMGTKNSMLETIKKYREAENLVPKTVVDTNVKDALAGKLMGKLSLKKQLEKTEVNAEKPELIKKMAILDSEIDDIFINQDPLLHEEDNAGNPLKMSDDEIQATTQSTDKPGVVITRGGEPIDETGYEVKPRVLITRGGEPTAETPVQEGGKLSDIETKKADIERRRQEDLSKLPNNGIVSKGDLITVKSNEADAIDAKYDAEVKALESVKPSVKTTEVIPEVTVEGTKQGYQVLSGNKKNAIGDIRQEASEARAAGKDSFTKETVKDGKKTFTLVDATASDDFGRPGFKSASITLPEGSKLTIEDVMPSLEAGLKGEKIEPIKIGEKAEVKPTKKVKSNAKEKNKTAKEIGIKLKSIDEKNIQPIPEGYFNTPEKQDLLNKFKNETITDAEIDKSMELLTDDEFIYIDKNFMQYPPEIEEAIAQIVPEMMANKYKDVTRGVEDIKLTINNGVKDGKISSDSAKIASVLLDKRPDLFTNLGVLLSPKEEGISTLGQYDPINKIIEIFDGNKNSTTLAHELLHHTEKFFPDNIKYAIREEWLSSIDKEIKDLNKSISKGNLNEKQLNTSKKAIEYLNIVKDNNNMFQGIDELDVNKYLKQRNDLYNYFKGENGLSSKYYNLFDASEWWANNSVDLLEKYANAKDKALIDKIKDFYKELIESIRQFVNPSKAKEVENALNNLLKGSYDKESSTNLSQARFESVKKSIEEPKYTQTEEQKSVDEEAKNMGFEMPKKEVASTAKVELTDKQKQSNIDKATAKQRAEAINQTEQEYGSTTDKGVPTGETAGVSGDVSSEPAPKIESTKSATPQEQSTFDEYAKSRRADPERFKREYESERFADFEETEEEYLLRKFCK